MYHVALTGGLVLGILHAANQWYSLLILVLLLQAYEAEAYLVGAGESHDAAQAALNAKANVSLLVIGNAHQDCPKSAAK